MDGVGLLLDYLFEGRFEQAIEKYPNAADFLQNAKKVGIKPKYINWLVKAFNQTNGLTNTDIEAEDVYHIVNEFDILATQNKITKKDINQYRNINELFDTVLDVKEEEEKKAEQKKSEKTTIYQDANYLIIKPHTTKGSCKYGKNTRWCISSKENNKFEEYTEQGAEFYFIINKQTGDRDAIMFFGQQNPIVYNAKDQDFAVDYLLAKYPEEFLRNAFPKLEKITGYDFTDKLQKIEYFKSVENKLLNPQHFMADWNKQNIEDFLDEVVNIYGTVMGEKIYNFLIKLVNQLGDKNPDIFHIFNAILNEDRDYVTNLEPFEIKEMLITLRPHLDKLDAAGKEFYMGLLSELIYAALDTNNITFNGLEELIKLSFEIAELGGSGLSFFKQDMSLIFYHLSILAGQKGYVKKFIELYPELLLELLKGATWHRKAELKKILNVWAAGYITKQYNVHPQTAKMFMEIYKNSYNPVVSTYNDEESLEAAANGLMSIMKTFKGIDRTTRYIDAEIEDDDILVLTKILLQSKGDVHNMFPNEFAEALKRLNEEIAIKRYFAKFLID